MRSFRCRNRHWFASCHANVVCQLLLVVSYNESWWSSTAKSLLVSCWQVFLVFFKFRKFRWSCAKPSMFYFNPIKVIIHFEKCEIISQLTTRIFFSLHSCNRSVSSTYLSNFCKMNFTYAACFKGTRYLVQSRYMYEVFNEMSLYIFCYRLFYIMQHIRSILALCCLITRLQEGYVLCSTVFHF